MLDRVENKIKREEYKIDSLLERSSKQNNWDFDTLDVHRYRRRMIPFYLLEKESNAYPIYVDNSDLKMSQNKEKKQKNTKVDNFKLCEIRVENKGPREKQQQEI
jgi:hypothetical protein